MSNTDPLGSRKSDETTIVYSEGGAPILERAGIELVVSKGPDVNARCSLTDHELVVGTHPDADLTLSDRAVSRKHMAIALTSNGARVRDLDSTNGVFAGNTKISEAVIPSGSSITIGETTIELLKMVEHIPLPLSRRRKFGDLIGTSAAMRQTYTLLEQAALVDATVLLEGETGTGKELAARAVHTHSNRAGKPFQIVDCGAVSPTLIEAELFGHTKGAFTGAEKDRAGAFELADGGTLFFDEIGELPLGLQPKLLRAIESRTVQRVGASDRRSVDVRFIAATHRNLEKEVKAGRFREDLLYRLNVFKIQLPPLREHTDDIPLLVEHFLGYENHPAVDDEMLTRFAQHNWPGNVRELRNAVEKSLIIYGAIAAQAPAGEPESATTDPGARGKSKPPSSAEATPEWLSDFHLDADRPFKDLKAELIDAFEIAYLLEVLGRTDGNISKAARESGIDRKHLERLVRKHELKTK